MRGKFSFEKHHRSLESFESMEEQEREVQQAKKENSYRNLADGQRNESGRVPSTSSQKNVKIFTMEDDGHGEDDVFEDYHITNTLRSNTRSPRFEENDATSEIVLRPHNQRVRPISASLSSRSLNSPKKSHSSGDLQGFTKNYRRNVPGKNSKNDDMILQLVIPSNTNTNGSVHNSESFPTPPTLEEILGQNHLKDRSNQKINSYPSNTDLYSGIYNGGPVTYSRPQSYVDLAEFARSNSTNNFGGLPRVASAERFTPALSSRSEIYLPTPPEVKKKAFVDILTRVLSVMYALFMVTFGVVLYVTDLIQANGDNEELSFVPENFSLFMVISSFLYVLYLTIDIVIYMRKKATYEKLLEKNTPEQIEIKENADGNYELNIKLPEMVKQMGKTLEHHYCFNNDRHSANFYLKIGAVGFCFGHLIHCFLLLGYRFVFISGDFEFSDCISVSTIILEFVYPLYSFFLLFFIFKYSNVIINRNMTLARFGLMHCLSASVCFWLWTIIRETVEYLDNNRKEYDYDNSENITTLPTPTNEKDGNIASTVNIETFRFTKICESDTQLRVIYQNYSPYLYPFSVEYSILVVGVLYVLWQNIGFCHNEFDHEDEHHDTKECANPKSEEPESNIAIHVDCHASNKGLFGGIIILVFTVISIILFFISIYHEDSDSLVEQGYLVNTISSLILVSIMSLACLLAYRQIIQLDVNKAAHNTLDNILLVICIPAFFLNGIFSILPAVLYQEPLAASSICIETFQVVLQTVFIMDGMQRCSNTKQLRKNKPGRELVTFLVICNVAMWIMQTFEVKSHGLHDYRYEFYSKELWSIIGHMCLPLMMFYRFHSSVCLGDIWKYGYVPAGH